tara:strand:+ start:2752 stop:3141 length:390 start_codon:yes stop_codon:yes gene_type:complete
MTCFWDGILQALDTSDFQVVGCNNRLNRQQLINLLKTKNVEIEDVTWNGNKLTRQEMKEHFNAIKDYNINNIYQGHLCSPCDSFLLLISQLFNVNIKHLYLNVNIEYKNEKVQRKTLKFASNHGHFWKN